MTIKVHKAEHIIFVGLRLDRAPIIIKEEVYAKAMLFKFLVQRLRFPEQEYELHRAINKIYKRTEDLEYFCMENEDDYRVDFIKMVGINMLRLIQIELTDVTSDFNQMARYEASRAIKQAIVVKQSNENQNTLKRTTKTLEQPKPIVNIENQRGYEVVMERSDHLADGAQVIPEAFIQPKPSNKQLEEINSKKSEPISKSVSTRSAKNVKVIPSDGKFASNAKYGTLNTKNIRNSPPQRRTPQATNNLTFNLKSNNSSKKFLNTRETPTKFSTQQSGTKKSTSKSRL